MNENHLKVLKASDEIARGKTAVINRGDAEECVDLDLVEPTPGYPLTEKGKKALKDHQG